VVKSNLDNIVFALDMTRSEIGKEIELVNNSVARDSLLTARRLQKFDKKVISLIRELSFKKNTNSDNIKKEKKKLYFIKQNDWEIPVLNTLIIMGGTSYLSDLIIEVGEKMKHKFGQDDKKILPKSNRIRWQSNVRQVVSWLRQRGFIKPVRVRALVEISPLGVRELQKMKRSK
jgi:hypothetical protein